MDDLPVGPVAEADVLHFDLAVVHLQFLRVRGVGRFRLLVQQREDPFGRREGRLEFADDVGQLVDRAGELAGVENERGEVPQRQRKPPAEEV